MDSDSRIRELSATVARCDAVRTEAAYGGCSPARLALAEQVRKPAAAELRALLRMR